MSRNPVDISRVHHDELADVLLLWAEGQGEVLRGGRPGLSLVQVGARLDDAISSGRVEVILARREGRPAGFIVLREAPLNLIAESPSLCIDHFYVCPGDRRHGIAKAMLSYVAGRAERMGAEQVIASVPPWARETHRFFARLGFSPVSVRRTVSPLTLRRRLAGDAQRGGLENLLSRRRSLRAKARRLPSQSGPPAGQPTAQPPVQPAAQPTRPGLAG